MMTKKEIREYYASEVLRLTPFAVAAAKESAALEAEATAAEAAYGAAASLIPSVAVEKYHEMGNLMSLRSASEAVLAATRAKVLADYGVPLSAWQIVDRYMQSKARVAENLIAQNTALLAWRSTRSRVSEALQADKPPPHISKFENEPGGTDPEIHHARQKVHFMGLWKDVDAAVLAAGIVEKGAV